MQILWNNHSRNMGIIPIISGGFNMEENKKWKKGIITRRGFLKIAAGFIIGAILLPFHRMLSPIIKDNKKHIPPSSQKKEAKYYRTGSGHLAG